MTAAAAVMARRRSMTGDTTRAGRGVWSPLDTLPTMVGPNRRRHRVVSGAVSAVMSDVAAGGAPVTRRHRAAVPRPLRATRPVAGARVRRRRAGGRRRCRRRSCGLTRGGGRCATTTIRSGGCGAVALNLLADANRRSAARKRRAIDRLAAEPMTVGRATRTGRAGVRCWRRCHRSSARPSRLYYVDQLSVAEVAAAMELAEGSVKSHLHDARRRLRAVLDREG